MVTSYTPAKSFGETRKTPIPLHPPRDYFNGLTARIGKSAAFSGESALPFLREGCEPLDERRLD
jgi:hypothetical protein